MKKTLFASVACLLAALCFSPDTFAATTGKKSKDADPITTAAVWTKKTKDYEQKTVSTMVLDIGKTGTVMSNAQAAVVRIETGDKKNTAGGKILVVMPTSEFEAFTKTYAHKDAQAGTAFGGKIKYEKLSATFAKVGDEFVLLYKIKPAELSGFSPSKALQTQKGGDNAGSASSGASTRTGYEKKIFYVSKLGEKPYTKQELTRLIGLHNKSVKTKSEKLKEADVHVMLEEEDDFITIFDEKAKIEWELRN